MLRECRRVLRSGGRLAVATIELAEGLGGETRVRAVAAGPTLVDAPAGLRELVRRTGFTPETEQDVTEDFRRSVAARLDALERDEDALRAAEGDEAVDEEKGRRVRLLSGIDEGLLRRTMIIAAARDDYMQTSAGVT